MLALRSATRSYRCVCTGCAVTSRRSVNDVSRSFNRSVNNTFTQTVNQSFGHSSLRHFGSYHRRSGKKQKKPNLAELPREFAGVVTNVFFESRHRGWAAMKVVREPTLDEQTIAHLDAIASESLEDSNNKPEPKPKRSAMVSGVVPASVRLAVGLPVKLTGRWMYDSELEMTKFEFDSFTEIESKELSRDGMIEQLSVTLPHIGPGLATKLVDHFGEDVYRMLDERDQNIIKVPRFPKSKLNLIFDAWHALKKVQIDNVEEIMFLLEHHLSPGERAQLLQKYEKHELCRKLLWNPYICMQVEGISFAKADGLAMRLGFELHDERRLRAAIMFNLSIRARQNGCSFVSESDLSMWSHASLQQNISTSQLEPTMDVTEIDESMVVPLDPPELSVSKQKVDETIAQLVAENIIKRELIEGFHHSWDKSYEKTVEYRKLVEAGEVNPQPHQSISQSSQNSIVACYHVRTWALEEGLAQRFARMLSPEIQAQRGQRLQENYATAQALQRSITNYERNNNFRFTEEQREAVIQSSTGAITIITGYPGTGKTQILKALVSLWREYNTVTLLCSPTGRAASKMQEMTGRPAMTMHRALDWVPFIPEAKDEQTPEVSRTGDSLTVSEFSGGSFKHNSSNPLKASAYVIDEMSMVDLPLMYSMMEAIPLDAQIVLVGDPDQLPAVGAGNVLHDLIHSGAVNVVRLTQTIRQAEQSILNQNARAVHQGIQPKLLDVSSFNPSETSSDVQLNSDAMFVQASKDAADSMRHLFTRVLPNLDGQIDPLVDVQVLTPKRERGAYSAANLNRIVQSMLNPPCASRAEIRWYDSVFRVGDRVMQKRNNAVRGVYNGELGEVIAIGPAPVEVDKNKSNMPIDVDTNQSDEPPRLAITIRFDPRLKVADQVYLVDGVDMQEIGLAWALTVHKSQGGEFRVCVFACATEHERMLTRPLLYTAITRAKEKLIIVGDRHVLKWGARNKLSARFTALRVRLRRAMGRHDGATITVPATEITSIDQSIDQSNDQSTTDTVDSSSSQSDESEPLFDEPVSDVDECSGITFEPASDEKQHMHG